MKSKNSLKYNLLIFLSVNLLLLNNSSFFPWEYVNNNSKAIKEYNNKNYNESEKYFRKSLDDKSDSLELKFNLSASLYKQKRYIETQTLLLEIINNKSTDIELKQKAHYNLGNVLYRLGEQSNPDIFWNNSLLEYQRALNIASEDKFSKENYEFVKQKLKKQSQRNNQNNSESDKTNQQNNQSTPQQNQAYSNQSDNQNNQDKSYDITKAEAENILKELKSEEENMQNEVNRRAFSSENKDKKDNSLKKDW
ncbi:MAG: hypothetical protein U0354_04920 [Candidatus Sericytochromatia bacterium]